MESLEIKVYDTITTFDTLVDGIQFVLQKIKEWFESGSETPLEISVKKTGTRAPPALDINVSDVIKGQSGLV